MCRVVLHRITKAPADYLVKSSEDDPFSIRREASFRWSVALWLTRRLWAER